MASPLGLSFTPKDAGLFTSNGEGIKTYRVVEGKAIKSLFDSGQFSPYPTTVNKGSGSVEGIKTAFDVHDDKANDISISSIIEHCNQFPSMKLDYAHFAYLRNLGVYPNNRLIIARRFAGAVANDLTAVSGSPLATIVGYITEEDDKFFDITFNEEWEGAAGSFEEILNEIGNDVKLSADQKGKAGSLVSAALNMVPMPALMEGVQILVRQKMGLAGGGQGPGASPYGNPNLIREARQRKVLGKGEAGSALTAQFSIKFTVEYEQKFISGIDPTLVYMDILQNALTFGTSDASFEYSGALASGVTDIIGKLISGDIQGIIESITEFLQSLLSAITAVIGDLVEKLIDPPDEEEPDKGTIVTQVLGAFSEYFKISVGTVISKYKIRILGVANALSGAGSTPWHITIGNPKKPMLSTGDMECTSVNLSVGKVLAFNDLPSSITLSIDLKSARNLGAQEIFNRMNTGKGRSYKRLQESFPESDDYTIPQIKTDEVDKKIKEIHADTQKSAPAKPDPSKNQAAGGQQTETKAANDKKEKTEPTDNKAQAKFQDDYPVKFSQGSGDLWGTKYSTPPPKDTKTGDNTNTKATNEPQTKASDQSKGDADVKTSGIAGASNATNTPPSTAVPGVTQSTSAIQQQQAAGQTGTTVPQSENIPAPPPLPDPPPQERQPELVFDANGNVIPANTEVQQDETPDVKDIVNTFSNSFKSNTTDSVKSEEIQKEQKVTPLLESPSGVLAQVYNQLDRTIESSDSEISKLEKQLASANTQDAAALTEKIRVLMSERDSAIKTQSDIMKELKNRKMK